MLQSRLLIAGLLAAALGCAECEQDFDCPGTQLCNASGECEAFVCKRSQDCPPGHVCGDNRCEERAPSQDAPDAPDALVLGQRLSDSR